MEEDYWKEYRKMQKVLQKDDQELLFFLIACKHDIILLDKVVGRMNNGSGQLQRNANNTLTELKEHPDAWTIVGPILALSQNQQTKYYALQILENGILIRWAGLPQLRTFGRSYQSRNEREGIRKYIVDLIIETYSGLTLADDGKPYRRKLNDILVQIVKQNLLKNWSPFMDKIIAESEFNESLCNYTMYILKQLSEELLYFPRYHRNSMCNEFDQVFQLCQSVLENSQNAPLVEATLNTLLLFLNWIPLEDIFETELINKLVNKFLGLPMFRNTTLRCLTKIAGINVQEYEEGLKKLFWNTMIKLRQMLPTKINMESAYASGSNDDQNFIQNIVSFLCIGCKKNVNLIERTPNLHALLLDGHEFLVLISKFEEREIFKICLGYWKHLSGDLWRESFITGSAFIQRHRIYLSLLSKIRLLCITQMAQPAYVLVLVENEQGEVVGKCIEDADHFKLCCDMEITLLCLARFDYTSTTQIMTEKLHNQVNGTEWSCKNLNTLCWAIGSIYCVMGEKDARKFVFTVLRDLLELAAQRNRTDNDRRIIASNIMFIGAEYPRCLSSNWKNLKKFTNWVFDFMHDAHDGIKVLACDTFLKLALECPKPFLQKQAGEDKPFIEEIINFISTKTGDLQSEQKHTFYKAVGYIVGAVTDISVQENLIEKVQRNPNQEHQEMKKTFYSTVHLQRDRRRWRRRRRHMRTHINMHWYMPWPMKRHFIDYIENDERKEMLTKFTAKRKPFRRPVEL